VTRAAFETAAILRQYPEIDGVTHAAIRKAVGTWARTAVYEWHQAHRDDEHCLLGEVPLIGNRLMELAQPQVDAAEALLRSEQTLFVVPVPSTAVRQIIEEARARSINAPQHEKETRDAPPNVLHGLWHDLARLGYELALTKTKPVAEAAYEPEVYTAVYQHLLQHRHCQILPINNVLKPTTSAYDWQPNGTELTATETAVAQTMRHIEQQYSPDTLEQIVSRWFEL
jgi:hypothetical protein